MQKETILELLEKALQSLNSKRETLLSDTEVFGVDVQIKPGNNICISIDSEKGITIDDCIAVSRFVEGSLDREKEDFALEVASAGLDQPLKIWRQYKKNIGRRLKVLDTQGEKYVGVLLSADEKNIILECDKPKKKGKKVAKEDAELDTKKELSYLQLKEAKIDIVF